MIHQPPANDGPYRRRGICIGLCALVGAGPSLADVVVVVTTLPCGTLVVKLCDPAVGYYRVRSLTRWCKGHRLRCWCIALQRLSFRVPLCSCGVSSVLARRGTRYRIVSLGVKRTSHTRTLPLVRGCVLHALGRGRRGVWGTWARARRGGTHAHTGTRACAPARAPRGAHPRPRPRDRSVMRLPDPVRVSGSMEPSARARRHRAGAQTAVSRR